MFTTRRPEPPYDMNAFSISASGEEFEVDQFLEVSQLVPTRTFRRGDQKGSSPWSGHYAVSGVVFELGDGQTVPVSEQETIATAFLQANRDELRNLAKFPGVERFALVLHCRRENVERNLYGFSICTSPSLMWHLLDTECTLSHFVTLEYREPPVGA